MVRDCLKPQEVGEDEQGDADADERPEIIGEVRVGAESGSAEHQHHARGPLAVDEISGAECSGEHVYDHHGRVCAHI